MKLLHLSDLHIGKRVNEFSMLEDQRFILKKIISIVDEIKPDAILLAGDIYDRPMPATEAVELLDEFLTDIARRKLACFVISGNHDSVERMAFGASIMAGQGIHISKAFDGSLAPTILEDEFGPVHIFMLPYIKPANVRRFYPNEEIESYESAARTVIQNAELDPQKRNILLMHQFITSAGTEPERCESESLSLGGLDNIDVSVFDDFDYVALGHIHGPQRIGRDTVRYAGSPLKYSFSEARHNKSVTVVDLGEKGDVRISTIPLPFLRDFREIKGPMEELLKHSTYEGTNIEDYLHIILTDEEDILDAIGKLHTVYPNIMRLDYQNKRSGAQSAAAAAEDIEKKTPVDLFREFYELQNGMEMDPVKTEIIRQLSEKLGGEQR